MSDLSDGTRAKTVPGKRLAGVAWAVSHFGLDVAWPCEDPMVATVCKSHYRNNNTRAKKRWFYEAAHVISMVKGIHELPAPEDKLILQAELLNFLDL